MIRRDLLVVPFGAAEVSRSGDAATATDALLIARWSMRALGTSPGEMMHRPNFGAVISSYLGLPGPAALSSAARAAKRAIERHPDVRAVEVTATAAPAYGNGTISLEVGITTASGVRNNFSVRA